jgi:hypothetical protein
VRSVSALAVIGVLLFVLAGCSSGPSPSSAADKVVFDDAYLTVTADFQQATEQIKAQGTAALGGDQGGVLEVYRNLRKATRDARTGYAGLDAPDDLDDEVASLVGLLDAQTAALDDVLTAAEARDGAALQPALERFAKLLSDWSVAHQDLLAKL